MYTNMLTQSVQPLNHSLRKPPWISLSQIILPRRTSTFEFCSRFVIGVCSSSGDHVTRYFTAPIVTDRKYLHHLVSPNSVAGTMDHRLILVP